MKEGVDLLSELEGDLIGCCGGYHVQKSPTLSAQLLPGDLVAALLNQQPVDDLLLPSQLLLSHLPVRV